MSLRHRYRSPGPQGFPSPLQPGTSEPRNIAYTLTDFTNKLRGADGVILPKQMSDDEALAFAEHIIREGYYHNKYRLIQGDHEIPNTVLVELNGPGSVWKWIRETVWPLWKNDQVRNKEDEKRRKKEEKRRRRDELRKEEIEVEEEQGEMVEEEEEEDEQEAIEIS